MSSKPKNPSLGGVKAVVEMLSHMDEESRSRLLKNVAEKDPRLADEIQKSLLTFEDLIHANVQGIQILLREVPQPRLALALRKASEELKEFLFENMSQKSAQILKDEIDSLGPQRVSEVEKAQNEILEKAKKLQSDGKLYFLPA